jgi:CBS domain-containing protein
VRISDLLAGKGSNVATVTKEQTVAEAVAKLATYRVGALVVSADGKQIDGIVSERDIVRRLNEDAGLMSQPVSSIMSSEVSTCTPEEDLESLMTLMTERRIRHVPVVENGELAGIVSIGDVVKSRIGELEKDRNELVDYIQAR